MTSAYARAADDHTASNRPPSHMPDPDAILIVAGFSFVAISALWI